MIPVRGFDRSAVPVVTDLEEAARWPELGVLSAMAHGSSEEGAKIAFAVLPAIQGLDDGRARFYFDLLYSSLNEAARQALETTMKGCEYLSYFARKYFEQGYAEGLAEAPPSPPRSPPRSPRFSTSRIEHLPGGRAPRAARSTQSRPMITLIEALGFRCLRYISQPLGPFHVLVGPNASGKTTFLDVVAFLGRLVSDGPDAAIEERTQNFYDLLWRHEGTKFELAVEAQIPAGMRSRLPRDRSECELDTVRYEVVIGLDPATQEMGLEHEYLLVRAGKPSTRSTRAEFLRETEIPDKIARGYSDDDAYVIAGMGRKRTADFPPEVSTEIREWNTSMRRRSFLQQLPPSKGYFAVSTFLKELLSSGVQQFVLNSLRIRKASPPGQGPSLRPDGINLPWIVEGLRQRSSERFRQWLSHLQTAFPDLEDINTIERPEDRHRYLVLRYRDGLEVPSWMVSDGTLRMLALTLPAYLDDFRGIYLIEEPENGIHPRAIETMTQSLSSVYNAQVLLATHSPVILSTVEAEQVLCFAKTPEGATKIIRGSEHPALQSWKHETTLGTLFAAGVLG